MSGDKRTIMVVDDNIDFLEQFREMLHFSGYETVGFENGEQALGSLKQIRPDLILLDLRMNGISGLDVVKAMRSDPETQHIAVILVSAYCADIDVTNVINEYKVARCINKPVKPLDVIAEIESVFAEMNSDKKTG